MEHNHTAYGTLLASSEVTEYISFQEDTPIAYCLLLLQLTSSIDHFCLNASFPLVDSLVLAS